MRIVTLVLLAVLSNSNGNEFAGDSTRDTSTLNAQIYDGVFLTRLDHFRPQDYNTVQFTYQVNDAHYQPGGPLYIYIKDIRDSTTRWIESGLMVDIAAETNGALFTFNHRYHGLNRPTQNASFENMEFLTVEQSLADIATFIRFIRSQYEVGVLPKVILFGSGYGGTIATWTRKKYPHLVDGVWSSSGVFYIDLYSFTQYDLLEYIIGTSGSRECSDSLVYAFAVIESLIQNGQGEYLQEAFNLCNPVATNSVFEIGALYEQYLLFITDYINRLHTHGILNFCRAMEAIPGDPFNSFVRWVDFIYGTPECFDPSFNGLVERNSNVEWDSVGTNSGRRQWYYSQCTQIGSFVISDEFSWLPGRISVFYHMEKCRQVLGENYDADLLVAANDALIREFGSTDLRVTNVIFTNGRIDPWLYTGILYSLDSNTTVITIEAYAKSADLTSINRAVDTALLVQAKEQIRSIIIDWST